MKIANKILIIFPVMFFVACGPPPYTMETPASFKRFAESNDFRMITANGVKLEAREVENYPKASLEFWTNAMNGHLEAQGYLLKSKECFKTVKGLNGCTLDFMLPHGAEDWVLSETIFVVNETIVLIEAAASFEKYSAVEKELKKAITTFEPNL